MADVEPKRITQYLGLFAHEILLPFLLVILGIVIFDPIKEWWLGPRNYKIYLVGAASPEIDKIFRGVRLGNGVEPLEIDDVPIALETVDDQGDAATTAKYIASKDDALLVIGHVYSQRTINALPTYMEASPPIPVIATKETSRDLLTSDAQKQCGQGNLGCPVLQMSPTNDEQAVDALEFALNEAKKRRALTSPDDHYDFVIVKQANGANGGYINDLVDRYEDLLQGDYSRKRVFHPGTINVGDAGTFSTVVSSVMSLKPDAIIYVGQSPLARQFFSYFHDQVIAASSADATKPKDGQAHTKGQLPLIMLCDAAVSPDVTSKGFMGLSNVFAMYPISFSEYRQTDSVLGRDAFALVAELVKEAGYHRPLTLSGNWWYGFRQALQMHRAKDARAALALAFQDAIKGTRGFVGPTGNEYAFQFPGHRKNGRFHVWAITGTGAIEADSMDGDAVYVTHVPPQKGRPVRGPRQGETYAAQRAMAPLKIDAITQP